MSRAFLSTVAAALLLSGCANQESAPYQELKALFQKADKSGDGRVSREEFADFLIAKSFSEYDRNGDGEVTLEEFLAGGGTTATFRKIARPGRNSFTLAEALANREVVNRMAKPFDEADVNGSGTVSWAEFVAWQERAQPYIR